jgi:hypothetical protein
LIALYSTSSADAKLEVNKHPILVNKALANKKCFIINL